MAFPNDISSLLEECKDKSVKEDVDIYGGRLLLANHKTVLNFAAFNKRQLQSLVNNSQNENFTALRPSLPQHAIILWFAKLNSTFISAIAE